MVLYTTWGCQATEETPFLIKKKHHMWICDNLWVAKKKTTSGVIFIETKSDGRSVNSRAVEDLFIYFTVLPFLSNERIGCFDLSCSSSPNLTCGRFSLLISFNPSSLRSCRLFQPCSSSLISSPLLPFAGPLSLSCTSSSPPLLLLFHLNCKLQQCWLPEELLNVIRVDPVD